MKHILKQQEPPEFTTWKANNPRATWREFSLPPRNITVKTRLHRNLMREQGRICCYCESKLTNKNSHIEHFVPRSLDANLTFDYNNLLCSCQANVKKGTPLTCGNAKGDTSNQNIISPLEVDCEESFTFTFDGFIKGKCTKSCDTVNILNLNEPNLVESRKNLIETFTVMLDNDMFTEDDLVNFVQNHLAQDNYGNFNEFWTTINYLFNTPPAQNV